MPVCPECGTALQTMDLPCPECALGAALAESASSLREHSRTFRTRTAYRYRPSSLAGSVSSWLAEQGGLLNVSVVFHRDLQGLTAGATATCQLAPELPGATIRLALVRLAGGLFGKRRVSPGDALNSWACANPETWRLNHWVFGRGGAPAELWILYAQGAPAQAPDITLWDTGAGQHG